MNKLEGEFIYTLQTGKVVGFSFIIFIIATIIMIFLRINSGLLYIIFFVSMFSIQVLYAVLRIFELKLVIATDGLNIFLEGRFFKTKIDHPYQYEGKMIVVSSGDSGIYFRLVITDSEYNKFCFFERLPRGQIVESVPIDVLGRQKDSKMIINTKPYPDFVWNLYCELEEKNTPKNDVETTEIDEESFIFENPFVDEG